MRAGRAMAFPNGYHKEEPKPPPIETANAAFRKGITLGNRHLGRRMRYCTHCGVGVGIMTRKQYTARYVHRKGLCPRCGEQVD